MGNQLVGVAPSQIFPVEHYLTGSFESGLQYESSMGSTRFLKVARAKTDEGLVVVKVFVKHDPSLPLEEHIEEIKCIKTKLLHAANCLPFQQVFTTDRACLIVREYIKHSLYDRVSTRPFLTVIEKKWITFQILYAMHQCHKHKIYHGDIKLENIMITAWNWTLLSDFASFKPTYLPENNPADYNFFFDTSRRRTCYIAPERFLKSPSGESISQKLDGPLVGDNPCQIGNLQPEMDIFSAGCALLELWTESTAPFEFSQLLAYRRGEVELVNKHLECIEDERLKNLLQSMLSPNPKDRKSAEIYLDQERGYLFPEYFYSFLQSYLQMFPSVPADERITRLYSDIDHLIKTVTGKADQQQKFREGLDPERGVEEGKPLAENDGLLLIIPVVTSCIRGLKFCKSKLSALEILGKISENTTSEAILDRILPYVLHLTQDSISRVRVHALDSLTHCLGLVKNLGRSNANVFPDYILPEITPLATDSSVMVRVTFAKNIATLAETAVSFLEQCQYSCSSENLPAPHYESELSALHEVLHQSVLSLLTDTQPIVKQMLMESGITKLCVFFGRQKANDVILSHMITFLNDKEDKNLRGSFFDCIVGVAAFVGWHCSPMLIPLLQQGLSDPEEFVIAKAIRATKSLIELGLIQKPGIIEFIAECACYLNHPNLWVRHEICALISASARVLSPLDVQCKIMPSIINHLKGPLIQVERPELLMDSLLPPIPRNIFDAVIKFPDINQLIEVLRERKVARSRCGEGFIPPYGEMAMQMKNLFRRLSTEGLTDLIETQLLSMSAHLIKLHRYKLAETRFVPSSGRICLDSTPAIVHEVYLADRVSRSDPIAKHKRKSETDNTQDWQHMFTAVDSHSPSPTSATNGSIASVLTAAKLAPPPQSTPSISLAEYSMPERASVMELRSQCSIEYDALITKMKARYASFTRNKELRDPALTMSPLPTNWKLNGTLVAHLHEHKAAVSRMTAMKPYGSLFASASIDGIVRLWDCNKLDGQQSINRSRQSYHANTPLHAIAACDSGQSLAIAGKDGTLLLLKLDNNSSKMALQQARHLDSNTKVDRTNGNQQDDGPVVDMQPLDQGAQSVIVYATLYGALIGWDIRMSEYAWRLESDLRKGVITTFCVDPTSSWLTVGTSSGRHICWDLRFRLPIAEIKHPYEARIRRVSHHPTEPSWLVSASQGNNEVYVWNIETNHRQQAFWASPNPPLSNANVTSHSVCALAPGVVDGNGFLLTGGTDQRIRYWDPLNVENCSLVVPAARDFLTTSNISYESRLIDGTRVISEIHNNSSGGSGGLERSSRAGSEDAPRSGPEMPPPGHRDVISDLIMCRTPKQTFVVSSSRDGVIKLWK